MDYKAVSVPVHSYSCRRDSMDCPPYKDQYYTDVYKPMLSECIGDNMTNSDIKLHDQWIVRRKRIIYFLTVATVFAVILCAISILYVVPNFFEDPIVVETKTIKDAVTSLELNQEHHIILQNLSIAVDDFIPNSSQDGPLQMDNSISDNDGQFNQNSQMAQIPTLQGDDYSQFNDGLSGESTDFYVYCIISAIPRYQKYSKKCNSIVFREVETVDPTLYFTQDDLDFNAIINVRITSPLSEDFVGKVLGIFPNIQKLTVCIDQLCFGSKEKDIDKLPIIDLPKVDTFEIVNSTLCPLASWIFNKWNLPSIEKLTIRQGKFPKKVYQSLGNFLERHHETLNSVDLKSCQCGNNICNNFANLLTPELTATTRLHKKRHHKSTEKSVTESNHFDSTTII